MMFLGIGCFAEPPGTGEGDTGSQCPAIEQPEPVDECPAICNAGCVDGECQIECRDDAPCNGQEIMCPPDFICDVDCAGTGVCEGTTVACPNDFACALTCEGANACDSAELACGFSECAVECGADETACAGTVVRCGDGPCVAECSSSVVPSLDGCAEACSCSPC